MGQALTSNSKIYLHVPPRTFHELRHPATSETQTLHHILVTMSSIPHGTVETSFPIKNDASENWTESVKPVPTLGPVMTKYRSYSPEFSKETERKLLRRIDKRILPLVVIIYIFNYMDRNSTTQARLYGLQKDTHVHGAVYNTAISIFSAGYIAMQLPSTLLMAKLRPSIFLVILPRANL